MHSGHRYADIAVNLTDPMFTGTYHGRQKHASDLDAVVRRARLAGVTRMLITATSLSETRAALELAERFDLQCTAGVHPTSTPEISKSDSGPEGYLRELDELIERDRGRGGSKRIVAIGEIGLDYDRLHFASRETQLAHLPQLLRLSQRYHLPLFLHSRHPDAHRDLLATLHDIGWTMDGLLGWDGAVVHSFTGTMAEMQELVDMGMHIGINGCSLKTPESLEVVKAIPLDRLVLETDAPWCSITSSYASHSHLPPAGSGLLLERVAKPERFVEGKAVKGRQEPGDLPSIAYAVASIRSMPLQELAEAVYDNAMRLFWPPKGSLPSGSSSHMPDGHVAANG